MVTELAGLGKKITPTDEFQSRVDEIERNRTSIYQGIDWENLSQNSNLQGQIFALGNVINNMSFDLNEELFKTKALAQKIELLTNAILQKNQDEVGLFRISGSASAVKELVTKLNQNPLSNIQDIKDVHTLAGTLKQILRDQTPHLLDAVKKDLLNIETPNVNEIQTALNGLKQKDQAILKTLITFLSEIAAHSEENKMNATNLATCMGPNLLTITQTINPLDEVQETLKVNTLTAFMIEHSADIFN